MKHNRFVDVVQSIINDSDRNHDVTLMYQLLQKIVTNFSEKYREWARSIMNERGKRKRTSRMVIDNNHSNDSSEEEEEYRQETVSTHDHQTYNIRMMKVKILAKESLMKISSKRQGNELTKRYLTNVSRAQ